VQDRLGYACRLLRKAQARGARVVVSAPPEMLARLDALLWTFEPTDFVPHLRVVRDAQIAPHLKQTPIWLVDRVEQAPHHEVLLNLGDDLVPGFESFERVIEIVPEEEAPKQSARRRWKHYADRGYTLKQHQVSA
jgi:DNA polymerase III subunit chi